MGLDMYLHKVKREEVAYWRKANAIHAWFSRLYEKETGEELENCQDMVVSKENLIKLRDDCKRVVNSSKLVYKDVPVRQYDYDKMEYVNSTRMMKVLDNPSVAEELLPTQSGFFFGSTVYDESYVEDLKNTIEQIDNILNDVNFDEYDIQYHAWW
jgi:hypothetical protein